MSEIRLDVKTSGDAEPIKKITDATADLNREQEKLSNTGKGLATSPTDLNAPTQNAQPMTMEDLGAIEKVTAALERKIAVLQALGESTAEQEASLQKLNTALQGEEARTLVVARAEMQLAAAKRDAAKAVDTTGLSMFNATAYAKKYAEENRNLRNIAQGVNIELPILGRIINTLTSPMSAAAGATALLIAGLTKLYDAATHVEVFSDTAPWETMSGGIDKVADASSDAAVEALAFERALKAIAEAQESVSAATDKTIAKIKQQASALLELQNAEAALKIAQIDAAEKSGRISSVDAIKARTAVRDEYERKKNEVKDQAARDEIAARAAEEKKLNEQTGPLTEKKNTTAAVAEEVKEREIENAQRIANAKKNIDSEKANRKKLQDELQKAEESTGSALDKASPLTEIGRKIADLKQQIELSKTAQAAAEGVVDSGKKTSASRENDLKVAQEAAAKAAAEFKANETRKAQLKTALPELTDSAQADAAARARVSELDRQRRAVETQSRIQEENKKEAERKAREEEQRKREEERARKKAEEDIRHGRADAGSPGENQTAGAINQAANVLANTEDPAKAAAQNLLDVVRLNVDKNQAAFASIQKQISDLRGQVAGLRV